MSIPACESSPGYPGFSSPETAGDNQGHAALEVIRQQGIGFYQPREILAGLKRAQAKNISGLEAVPVPGGL